MKCDPNTGNVIVFFDKGGFQNYQIHHKSFSKISHFTLFILIYSTLLYGCCVFIYCMCVIRPMFAFIHTEDIKQEQLYLSVTNILHTFTNGRIGHRWYSSNVQTLKAYIVYRLWYILASDGLCCCSIWIHTTDSFVHTNYPNKAAGMFLQRRDRKH